MEPKLEQGVKITLQAPSREVEQRLPPELIAEDQKIRPLVDLDLLRETQAEYSNSVYEDPSEMKQKVLLEEFKVYEDLWNHPAPPKAENLYPKEFFTLTDKLPPNRRARTTYAPETPRLRQDPIHVQDNWLKRQITCCCAPCDTWIADQTRTKVKTSTGGAISQRKARSKWNSWRPKQIEWPDEEPTNVKRVGALRV